MKMLGLLFKQLEEKSEDSEVLELVSKGKDVLGQIINEKNGSKTSMSEIKDEDEDNNDSIKTEDIEEEEEEDDDESEDEDEDNE